MAGRIDIDGETCKGCGLCITVCPKKLIEVSEDLNTKGYYPASFKGIECSPDKKLQCTGCALCAITCPDVAIEVYRDKKSETQTEESTSGEG